MRLPSLRGRKQKWTPNKVIHSDLGFHLWCKSRMQKYEGSKRGLHASYFLLTSLRDTKNALNDLRVHLEYLGALQIATFQVNLFKEINGLFGWVLPVRDYASNWKCVRLFQMMSDEPGAKLPVQQQNPASLRSGVG